MRCEQITADGVIITPLTDRDRMDLATARRAMETLEAQYPGYFWFTECSGAQGVITIKNLSLDARLGYVIHLRGEFSASELEKLVMRGGGEILERFNVTRGRADYRELEELPEDFSGRVLCDA